MPCDSGLDRFPEHREHRNDRFARVRHSQGMGKDSPGVASFNLGKGDSSGEYIYNDGVSDFTHIININMRTDNGTTRNAGWSIHSERNIHREHCLLAYTSPDLYWSSEHMDETDQMFFLFEAMGESLTMKSCGAGFIWYSEILNSFATPWPWHQSQLNWNWAEGHSKSDMHRMFYILEVCFYFFMKSLILPTKYHRKCLYVYLGWSPLYISVHHYSRIINYLASHQL